MRCTWRLASAVGLGKDTHVVLWWLADPRRNSVTVDQRLRDPFTEHHGDPFDRMLVAQAQVEDVPIATADPRFAAYGVRVVW
jgi:PIN domain nuclease of toxin-antitoxin system